MTITSNHSEKMINLGPSEKQHVQPSDFEFLRTIGKGSFGKVFSARHKKEDTIYAIKVLNKKMILKRNEKNHIMSERNVLLKNLNHPFLVGLYYSFQTKDKLYFVLDYVNGGEVGAIAIGSLILPLMCANCCPFTCYSYFSTCQKSVSLRSREPGFTRQKSPVQ